jgi:hypothetical protein
MKIGIVQAVLVLGVACPLTPAVGQTPTQDVTALMQGDCVLPKALLVVERAKDVSQPDS